MSTAIIYLERAVNHHHWSQQFFESLLGNDCGVPIDDVELIFIRKGEKWPPTYFKSPFPFKTFDIPDEKYTLGSIRPVIEQLPHDKFLFFHSFSKILAPNWLVHYINAFKSNVGIVGATGSFENNQHIRTNAFMMNRKLFLEVTDGVKMDNRDDEAVFESGPDNLTMKVMARGLRYAVVDRHGNEHLDLGASANIFRRGFQENLLVADNRTYDYDVSAQDRRQWLSSLAWGTESLDHGSVPITTMKQRAASYIDWNYGLLKLPEVH